MSAYFTFIFCSFTERNLEIHFPLTAKELEWEVLIDQYLFLSTLANGSHRNEEKNLIKMSSFYFIFSSSTAWKTFNPL